MVTAIHWSTFIPLIATRKNNAKMQAFKFSMKREKVWSVIITAERWQRSQTKAEGLMASEVEVSDIIFVIFLVDVDN